MPARCSYLLLLFLLSQLHSHAQVNPGPEIAWQRCYGGSNDDYFTDAIHTSDGGIVACIKVSSEDGDLTGIPNSSAWIIKYNNEMEILWQQFTGYDICQFSPFKIFELPNYELIFGGYSGFSCDDYHGNADFALIKTDPEGNKLWQKSYGGPGTDAFESFLPTLDGGFLLTGRSSAAGGDIPFHYPGGAGDDDAILIKTDSAGEIIWLKVLGGSGDDGPLGDIVENERGYYIINIGAHSNDYDLAASGISGDKRWIVKLDSLGNIVDENFMSGSTDLYTYTGPTVLPYNDGFLIVGQGDPDSELYPTSPEHDSDEGALAIFNGALELSFYKQWGGSEFEGFARVIQDHATGNFYYLGASQSLDYDLPGNNNDGEHLDYWLFATDSNFNMLWSKNFGGSDPCGDLACGGFFGDIVLKDNMLYAFVKNTIPDSFPDFDIECGMEGIYDYYTDAWLVVFDLSTVEITEPDITEQNLFEIYPNPAAENIIIKNTGQSGFYLVLLQDILGKQVYHENVFIGASTYLDVSPYPEGFYLLSIFSNNTFIHSFPLILSP